ncbi:MAG: hypothetical protein GEV04_20085 [Actinophytocola sp.]|nr:hypothetical protein [Actinophytocola sp.]
MHPRGRVRILFALFSAMLLLPLSPSPVLAQPTAVEVVAPAGIAFRGEELVVAASGTGELLSFSGLGVRDTLISGLVPGAFTRGPTGVAVDGGGNVYVAVAEDGAVLFTTPDGTTGVYARGLGAPAGIAFDPTGNLYVADQAAHRVLRVSPARHVLTVADGFAAAPYGLAFSPDGVLHISTFRDGRVWRIVDSGAEEVAEVGPSAEGLAFDQAGNGYVGVGAAGKVVRVAPNGDTSTVITGLGGPLNLTFSGTLLSVAAQGEGPGSVADQVRAFPVGEAGSPPAAPVLSPTPLPDAPPHSVAHLGDGVAVDPAPFLKLLPRGVVTDVGRGAAEPTIGVTETGNVFYAAAVFDALPVEALARTEILRSTDQGLTWKEVTPGLPEQDATIPPTTLDPYVYVDPDTSRVFTIDLYVGCSYLSFSDDEGETWVPNPIACGIPGNDHQTITAGPTSLPTVGYPNAVYYCYNGVAYSGCGRSLDGGMSFHPAGVPFPPASGCGGTTGHVAAGPDETVYLPNAACDGGPQVAVSRDSGTTWTQVRVAEGLAGQHHEAHVATDASGNAYYLWVAGEDRLPYLAISRDSGATWSDPIMVGPPGLTESNLPTIAAGDEGGIALYYAGTSGDCCYEKQRGGETMWHDYLTVSVNALDEHPTWLTTTMNDPRDPQRRGSCGPGRCGGMFDFLEIIVDHEGRAWTTLSDTCTGRCAQPGITGSNDAKSVGDGQAGQLIRGPRLRGEGLLEPPPWFTR